VAFIILDQQPVVMMIYQNTPQTISTRGSERMPILAVSG